MFRHYTPPFSVSLCVLYMSRFCQLPDALLLSRLGAKYTNTRMRQCLLRLLRFAIPPAVLALFSSSLPFLSSDPGSHPRPHAVATTKAKVGGELLGTLILVVLDLSRECLPCTFSNRAFSFREGHRHGICLLRSWF